MYNTVSSVPSELDEYYSLFAGNTDFEEARIVLLGDDHIRMDLDIIRQLFLSSFPNSVLLLEGEPSLREVDQESHFRTIYVDADLDVYGWDDMNAHSETLRRISDQFTNPLYENINLFWEYHERNLNYTILSRNQSHIDTLDQLAEDVPEDEKMFVILGEMHLTCGAELLDYVGSNYSFVSYIPDDLSQDTPENQLPSNPDTTSSPPTTCSNRIIYFIDSEGETERLGEGWFNEDEFQIGSYVSVNEAIGTSNDHARFQEEGINLGVEYTITDVKCPKIIH